MGTQAQQDSRQANGTQAADRHFSRSVFTIQITYPATQDHRTAGDNRSWRSGQTYLLATQPRSTTGKVHLMPMGSSHGTCGWSSGMYNTQAITYYRLDQAVKAAQAIIDGQLPNICLKCQKNHPNWASQQITVIEVESQYGGQIGWTRETEAIVVWPVAKAEEDQKQREFAKAADDFLNQKPTLEDAARELGITLDAPKDDAQQLPKPGTYYSTQKGRVLARVSGIVDGCVEYVVKTPEVPEWTAVRKDAGHTVEVFWSLGYVEADSVFAKGQTVYWVAGQPVTVEGRSTRLGKWIVRTSDGHRAEANEADLTTEPKTEPKTVTGAQLAGDAATPQQRAQLAANVAKIEAETNRKRAEAEGTSHGVCPFCGEDDPAQCQPFDYLDEHGNSEGGYICGSCHSAFSVGPDGPTKVNAELLLGQLAKAQRRGDLTRFAPADDDTYLYSPQGIHWARLTGYPKCAYCDQPLTENERDPESGWLSSSHWGCTSPQKDGRFAVVIDGHVADGLRYTTKKRADAEMQHYIDSNPQRGSDRSWIASVDLLENGVRAVEAGWKSPGFFQRLKDAGLELRAAEAIHGGGYAVLCRKPGGTSYGAEWITYLTDTEVRAFAYVARMRDDGDGWDRKQIGTTAALRLLAEDARHSQNRARTARSNRKEG